jgi:hypothetical protein
MKCILIIGKKREIKQNNEKKKTSISNVAYVPRYQWRLPLVTWHTCNVTNGTPFFFFFGLSFFLHLVCIFFLFAPLYFYYLDISTIINYILFILLINYIYILSIKY